MKEKDAVTDAEVWVLFIFILLSHIVQAICHAVSGSAVLGLIAGVVMFLIGLGLVAYRRG